MNESAYDILMRAYDLMRAASMQATRQEAGHLRDRADATRDEAERVRLAELTPPLPPSYYQPWDPATGATP